MANQIRVICKRCNGTGQYHNHGQCFKCGGQGSLLMSENSAQQWGYQSVEAFKVAEKASENYQKLEKAQEVATAAHKAIEDVRSVLGFNGVIDSGLLLGIAAAQIEAPHTDRSLSGYAARTALDYINAAKQ